MRAFLAISLPPDVRGALALLQQELAQSQADVKWVEPDNLHVTLKFLGEITEEQRQAIEAMLRNIAEKEEPLTLSVKELGAFPSAAAPRVVWVGLDEGRERVIRMAEAIEREGAALALLKEERPFASHVTLGRVRSPRHRHELTQRLQHAQWVPPAPWRVKAVTLYQSTLNASGPTYTPLTEVPLSHA